MMEIKKAWETRALFVQWCPNNFFLLLFFKQRNIAQKEKISHRKRRKNESNEHEFSCTF